MGCLLVGIVLSWNLWLRGWGLFRLILCIMVGYGDFWCWICCGVFDLIGWFRGLVVWILSGFCLVELVLVFWGVDLLGCFRIWL